MVSLRLWNSRGGECQIACTSLPLIRRFAPTKPDIGIDAVRPVEQASLRSPATLLVVGGLVDGPLSRVHGTSPWNRVACRLQRHRAPTLRANGPLGSHRRRRSALSRDFRRSRARRERSAPGRCCRRRGRRPTPPGRAGARRAAGRPGPAQRQRHRADPPCRRTAAAMRVDGHHDLRRRRLGAALHPGRGHSCSGRLE